MPRYIDADEIQYTMLYKENWITNTGVEKQGVWKDDIDKMPTANVVEVVRCKDCRFYTFKPQQTSRTTSVRRCNRSAIVCTKPDDYCSYGEGADT